MKYVIWPLLILLISVRYITSRPVYHNGDNIKITATVLADPTQYSTEQYLRLAGLQVYLPSILEISYGDRIIVVGVVDNGKLGNAELIKDDGESIILRSLGIS